MTIEAEREVSIATVQLACFEQTVASDHIFQEKGDYWLDLCLTPRPRNARACFRDHWAPHRFERIGELFLVPSGQRMQVRTEGGRQASVICRLHADAVSQWFDGDLQWTDRRLEASLDIAQSSIRSLLVRAGQEARHPGFGSEVLMELIAAQMAIELSRYCASVAERPASGGLAPWRLRLIDERLTEMRAPPTLGELASLTNLSVRQLTRGFRASRDCSIGDYVEASRIEGAKRLLATEESVKAIAYSMGFASPSSFTYAFRRATGVTPSEFRAEMRGGGSAH